MHRWANLSPMAAWTRWLGLVSLLGCSPAPSERPENVLLVVVDTLRADRLGVYGHRDGLTPEIDRWAAGSTTFLDASAHAPWTLPSVASILTGRHPEQHGAGGRLGSFRALGNDVPTLAEHLVSQGYRTAAIVNVPFLGQRYGLARGFEECDERHENSNRLLRPAGRTTDRALEWLRERDRDEPFFLLVHYFDPHALYEPPQPYRRRFADPRDAEQSRLGLDSREAIVLARRAGIVPDEATLRRAEKLYDGEVAFVDAEFGRLLEGLSGEGLEESTVIVFTSDHGEEFLDHGDYEHGHTLYEELLHVPLILSVPGREATRVPSTVRHVDLVPTLCELLGVPLLPGAQGRSLVPFLDLAYREEGRPVLSHGNFWGEPLTALRTGGEKLIFRQGSPQPEYYRLREDPGEQENLAAEASADVRRLQEQLEARRRARTSGSELSLDPEELRLLEALGYGGERPPD